MRINVSGGGRHEVQKVTLTANVETVVTFTSGLQDRVLVKNLGVGSAYVEFDASASANSFELLAGDAYEFVVQTSTVHLLSSVTPKVQMIGFKS